MTTPAGTMSLSEFNTSRDSMLVAQLTELFGSVALAEDVVAARPFASVDQLCATASHLLSSRTPTEILDAINAHPPIGATVAVSSRSAAEQAAASDPAGTADLDEVRRLQPLYRQRFGWNFLIRASGLSSADILSELRRRADVDESQEWAFSVEQLDAINQLRLRGVVTGE